MIYYPTDRMIIDLHLALPEIPNAAERNFIEAMYSRETCGITGDQYNNILDLYNKYVAVPAAIPAFRHDGTHRG